MSLLVAFLTADTTSADAASNTDRWSQIDGLTAKAPNGCPSPFRASRRGRVTHLFGAQ